MKEYGYLLRDDPAYREKAEYFSSRLKDAGEFLAGLGMIAKLRTMEMTVTYQDPCHLAHGQRVRAQPRQLLQMIPGLKLTEMEGADRCCGSAGIYALTQPGQAEALLKRKVVNVRTTAAAIVATANPGCHLQIARGLKDAAANVRVMHPVSLLAEGYRREAVR